ncbi:MAG: hypothetical protein JSS69_09150 [Acidobacteria bacterium]|nr:hypothetical protein [Acidobacteriota bacterium]MBS1866072.1 hypothetical protein [Acidobacteriota bacterium]
MKFLWLGGVCLVALSLAAAQEPAQMPLGQTQDQLQQSQAQTQAQNPPAPEQKPAPAPDSQKPDEPKPKTSIERETGTSNDRIFEVMPNYGTVRNSKDLPPMTAGQKYRTATAQVFDYFAFPFNAALAGIGQAQNSPKSWGQGWGAYGKRFGATFADNSIGTYMTTAIWPSLLKEDPRYYRKSEGGTKRRILYSVGRLFVTRTDTGGTRFNASEAIGNSMATGLSNFYHAREDRTFARNFETLGMLYMWDGLSNELKEFWPDIKRKFKHKKPAEDH